MLRLRRGFIVAMASFPRGRRLAGGGGRRGLRRSGRLDGLDLRGRSAAARPGRLRLGRRRRRRRDGRRDLGDGNRARAAGVRSPRRRSRSARSPGCEPRVTVPRGVAFLSSVDCSRISISFDEDAVSPVICSSRVLPATLSSSCCTQVLSGSSREISSMYASAGGVPCFFARRKLCSSTRRSSSCASLLVACASDCAFPSTGCSDLITSRFAYGG